MFAFALLLLAGGAFALLNFGQSSDVAAAPRFEIPNPDTKGMEVPVAEAIERARANVERNPHSANHWGLLAAVLDAHDLRAHAEPAYRHALELAPDDLKYSYNLAVLLELQGEDLDESLALLREFADKQPEFPPAHFRIGVVLALQGKLEEAATAYRRALKIDPQMAVAHRNLGQTLLILGDCEGAIRELEATQNLVPDDGPTQAALAQAYTCASRESEAALAASRAPQCGLVVSLPDPVRYMVTSRGVTALHSTKRARKLVQDGQFEAAIRELKVAARGRPDDASTQEELARVYQLLGDSGSAQGHMNRARKLRE